VDRRKFRHVGAQRLATPVGERASTSRAVRDGDSIERNLLPLEIRHQCDVVFRALDDNRAPRWRMRDRRDAGRVPPQDADSVTAMRHVATGRHIMFARSLCQHRMRSFGQSFQR
jgi:hypothetical protein